MHQGFRILRNPGKKSERNGRNGNPRKSASGTGILRWGYLPPRPRGRRAARGPHAARERADRDTIGGLRGWVSRLDSARPPRWRPPSMGAWAAIAREKRARPVAGELVGTRVPWGGYDGSLTADRNLGVATPERNGSERIGSDRIESEAKPCNACSTKVQAPPSSRSRPEAGLPSSLFLLLFPI